jgi:hypothetical protein
MQTFESINELVTKCKFKTWDIVLEKDKTSGERPYIQVQFDELDRFTGNFERQMCRKWYLSYHMTDSEVIRTAHKAVRAAMEHEVDEAFEYDGARIFNPHMDLKLLAKAAKKVDLR